MRLQFVYKIWSGYDGFTPASIPDRMDERGRVPLGWGHYIDEVEPGSEVWVYFHGRGTPAPGVYLEGRADEVDFDQGIVWLEPEVYRADSPLTSEAEGRRLASLVAPRYRQVFPFPEAWEEPPLDVECDVDSDGASCLARRCDNCAEWRSLPRIAPEEFRTPARLRAVSHLFEAFVPAYWIVPSRCYLGSDVAQPIQRLTRLFMDLKTGARSRAYPFALGMYENLVAQGFDEDITFVASVPLSPDKEVAGEVNRTRLLGQELARLLRVQYLPALGLMEPISKRRPPWNGLSPATFEEEYFSRLGLLKGMPQSGTCIVVDDCCTRGSTLAACVRRVSAATDLKVIVATGGQMILTDVVLDDGPLRSRSVA